MINRLLPSIEVGKTKEQGSANMSIRELDFLVQDRKKTIDPEEKEALLQKYTFKYRGNTLYMEAGFDEVYPIHPSTEEELLTMVGTKKMFKGFAPTKFDDALNEAIQTNPWFSKTRVLRLANIQNERWVRAIVSQKYGYMDDTEWLANITRYLDDEWSADLVQIVDEFTHVRFTHKNSEALKKVGETMKRAIDIKNSEVGQGSIRVQFLNYILECTNGATSSKLVDFNKTSHLGGDRLDNFHADMEDILTTAKTRGWNNIKEQFEKAGELYIPHVDRFIDKSAHELKILKRMVEPIKTEFEIRPGSNSLYDVSMAYSKAAQRFERDDRQFLEKCGGKILDKDILKALVDRDVDLSKY